MISLVIRGKNHPIRLQFYIKNRNTTTKEHNDLHAVPSRKISMNEVEAAEVRHSLSNLLSQIQQLTSCELLAHQKQKSSVYYLIKPWLYVHHPPTVNFISKITCFICLCFKSLLVTHSPKQLAIY